MRTIGGRRNQRISEDPEVKESGGEHVRGMFLQDIVRHLCVN